MKLPFKTIFYALASLLAMVAILHFAKALLIPLIFGLLFSFILYPLVKWLTNKQIKKPWSIITVMAGVTLVVSGVIFIFSAQIVSMARGYRQFLDKLKEVGDTSIRFLNEKVGIVPDIDYDTLAEGLTSFLADSGLVMVSDTIRLTSSFVTYLSLSVIYTFLILLYRESLTDAITRFAAPDQRDKFGKMLKEVQMVGQQYLVGMVILVGILSILNSIGLLLLGIEYAIFFGFLAGLLAIVPYVVTLVGGLLPSIYALITYDSISYPLGFNGIFW
ncbi:MAG: AI-2E family transporter, partial [Cyclobacteriaceae bacterium]